MTWPNTNLSQELCRECHTFPQLTPNNSPEVPSFPEVFVPSPDFCVSRGHNHNPFINPVTCLGREDLILVVDIANDSLLFAFLFLHLKPWLFCGKRWGTSSYLEGDKERQILDYFLAPSCSPYAEPCIDFQICFSLLITTFIEMKQHSRSALER